MYPTSRYSPLTTEKERPVDGPNGFWRRENHLSLPVSETRAVQSVASRYTDYATPAVINSWPIENVPLSIFLSLNTDSVLQKKYNLPINDPRVTHVNHVYYIPVLYLYESFTTDTFAGDVLMHYYFCICYD